MKKLGKTEKSNNYRIRFNFPFFGEQGGGVYSYWSQNTAFLAYLVRLHCCQNMATLLRTCRICTMSTIGTLCARMCAHTHTHTHTRYSSISSCDTWLSYTNNWPTNTRGGPNQVTLIPILKFLFVIILNFRLCLNGCTSYPYSFSMQLS